MALCTLEQVKERAGLTGVDTHDDALTQVIAGVSGQLAGTAGAQRQLEKAERTDELTVTGTGVATIWLPVWPVVSVSSVKEAVMRAFGDADELVADTDYIIELSRGVLTRAGYWLVGRQTVRITCIAGYTTPDESEAGGYVQGETEVLMPAEIVEAAIMQTCFAWQRRTTLGLSGQSAAGGSVSSYAKDELLSAVRKTMVGYRRVGM